MVKKKVSLVKGQSLNNMTSHMWKTEVRIAWGWLLVYYNKTNTWFTWYSDYESSYYTLGLLVWWNRVGFLGHKKNNNNNKDNDYDAKCNDDDDNDDQFARFVEVDEMYDIPIEDLELDANEDVEISSINIHNVKVECSEGCHGSVDHI